MTNPQTAPVETKLEMFYSYSGLDRDGDKRSDDEWLQNELKKAGTQIAAVWNFKCLVKNGKGVFLSYTRLLEAFPEMHTVGSLDPVFLGLEKSNGNAYFAIDVSKFSGEAESGPSIPGIEGSHWVDLRREGPNLANRDAAILAFGRALVEWRCKNAFCSACGSQLVVKSAGHSLKCVSSSCGKSLYPRLDPAVIMLVTCGDFVLVGRQSRWVPGRYSLLAGFVETGETFEAAVCREVEEESKIVVDPDSIRYVASQPWPFPSSLMIGFAADVRPTATRHLAPHNAELVDEGGSRVWMEVAEREAVLGEALSLPRPVADGKELEDVRWVHRDFLDAVLTGEGSGKVPGGGSQFSVPGKYAIARILMESWLLSRGTETVTGTGASWPGSQIPDVEIDTGVFKYVLMRVSDGGNNSKLVVRGHRSKAFHFDILDATRVSTRSTGVRVAPLGGGRIEHNLSVREIKVYGFSQAFGMADHKVTAAILQKWYPLHKITTSNEGY